jgi:hypothetical protein
MKQIEERTRTGTYQLVVSITCDICKRTDKGDNWTNREYNIAETEIRLEEGNSYPEGGAKTVTTFDVCPDCFKNKLVPLMATLGAVPAVVETDW